MLDWRDCDGLAVVLWTARQACNGGFAVPWDSAGDKQQRDFRQMAQAAIDWIAKQGAGEAAETDAVPATNRADPPAPESDSPPESEIIPLDNPAESDTLTGSERDADGLTLAEAKAMLEAELCDDADGPAPDSIPF